MVKTCKVKSHKESHIGLYSLFSPFQYKDLTFSFENCVTAWLSTTYNTSHWPFMRMEHALQLRTHIL